MLRMQFSEERLRLPGPAIFFDRDGVINCRRPGDYILDWSQFLFIPGIEAALQQLATLHLPMIVISNQACVGKGLLDSAVLEEITGRMHQNFAAIGVFMAAAYYCIHRADENCTCRKPKPGLLQYAAGDYNIGLTRSVFIGDSDTDIQAGLAAGCKPILFGSTALENSGDSLSAKCIPVARTPMELFPICANFLKDCGSSEATTNFV